MSSEGWKKYKVRNICKSISITHSFDKESLIFLNTGDIEKGEFLHRDYSLVSQLPGQAKKTIKLNDILFSEIRPANGRYAIVDFENTDDYLVSTKLMVIRGNEKVDPRFLYLFLTQTTTLNWLQHLAESRSGTFPQITFENIADLDISLPPLSIQEKIVNHISALDDKIELNRQTNATLEAVAQALFKEWFVHFNFPGADGELVDSELGPIPKGWRVLPLDEAASFLNGLALQKFPPENEYDFLPVIKIRELKNGVTDSSDRATSNLPEKYIIHDGDLIFSWSGTLEVDFWVGGAGALNQHLFKVTSENYPLWFCYYWILYHLENFRNIAEEKTTTMGHIKREHLSSALCLIPDNFDVLNDVMSPIVEKMIENRKENISLNQIRDALLPKLMNGEIEV